MLLIVENGTGVIGANSYADLDTIRNYALARGVELSSEDAALEASAILAMDYLELKGFGLMSLSFPLDNDLFHAKISLAETLDRLQRAQSELCMQQHNGVALTPTRVDPFIAEDTFGPFTTKYSVSNSGGYVGETNILSVDSLLKPLLAASSTASDVGLLTTLRV